MKHTVATALVLAALLLSGCGTAAVQTAAAATVAARITASRPPVTTTVTQQAAAEATVLPGAQALVALARADLRHRLDLPDASSIAVRSVTAVEWPDAGLGCPDPNMMYAQVITPGFTIVLAVGDAEYEYHADDNDAIVLCQAGKPVQVARKG